ncbi:MAG TPA: GTP 3',8-cyclase MoaA [Anaeromyxobacteraceae bacterium]|nr:GTP 3',8-cyclase MoaA [Anaeromyxobacteraceae bacterium]
MAISTLARRRALLDRQGRSITYLRLSLTARCNFRCSYCTSGLEAPGGQLSAAEIRRAVSALAALGIRRVRLTGGEPTLRQDLVSIVESVRDTPGIEEVALTTNGQRLAGVAASLRRAGLSRVNVSVDTLDGNRLHRLSGRAASLARVLSGFEAAASAGFDSLKMNTVVMRGVNDDELAALARYAWSLGATPRFIELMPFGPGSPVPVSQMKVLLAAQGIPLQPDATRGWGPAHYMHGESAAGRGAGLVGFIGAMSEGFCATCNRIRLGPNGALRPCLGGRAEVPLRDLLQRDLVDVAAVEARVAAALEKKGDRHDLAGQAGLGRLPLMAAVGG